MLSLCKDKGMTLKELSEKTGISYVSLRKYSRGLRTPTIENFALICVGLDESPKTVLRALGVDTSKIPNDYREN